MSKTENNKRVFVPLGPTKKEQLENITEKFIDEYFSDTNVIEIDTFKSTYRIQIMVDKESINNLFVSEYRCDKYDLDLDNVFMDEWNVLFDFYYTGDFE